MKELPISEQINADTKKALDAVSPSFCLAKWLQGTLHLHRGLTHSCHHPMAHHIPLAEIAENPAALNNTKQKIEIRKAMVKGEKPAECQYCWNVEASGSGHYSDRILLSKNNWAMPHLQEVTQNPLQDKIAPRYLEVSFSRACNFKCSYCAPAFSSKWAQDILEHGPYPAREHEHLPELLADLYPSGDNPYTKAFWEWWPDLKKSLHTFRLTGGEPLLSPHTFKVLERLQLEPAPAMHLAVNSNLGVSKAVVEKFCHLSQELLQNKKIAQLEIYTSLEAADLQAEYIRFGLDARLFWNNLEMVMEKIPQAKVVIMCTFNALSLISFKDFLIKVLRLREKFHNEKLGSRVILDIAYLRHPFFQAAHILPAEYQQIMKELILFMAENNSAVIKKSWGFYSFEQQKLERILEWMKMAPPPPYLKEKRRDFYQFFSEHDRRRGTDFLKTFPQMAKFWDLCRLEHANAISNAK